MATLKCSHCSAYVGDCGHEPGMTTTVTLSGTCGKCERKFTISCDGSCLSSRRDYAPTDLSLRDGSLVDSNGGLALRLPAGLEKSASAFTKLPGKLVCKDECIAWDSDGKCVQTVRSCTWEFPPFDF